MVSQVQTEGPARLSANVEGASTARIQPSFVGFSNFSRNLPFKVKSSFPNVDNQLVKTLTHTTELTLCGVQQNTSIFWILPAGSDTNSKGS